MAISRYTRLGAIAILLSLAGAACRPSPPPDTTLTMVTAPDYCPYEFWAEDGTAEVQGFDIDLAQAISTELGYDLTIETVQHFNQIMPRVIDSEVDFAAAAITPTPARQQVMDFSKIYYVQKMAIISPQDEGVTGLEQLINQTVGVRQDSFHIHTLMQYSAITVDTFTTSEELIAAVKRGRVDAAIMDHAIAPKYVTPASRLTWHPVDPISDVAGVAIAFPRNASLRRSVNQVIETLRQNGTLTRLIDQWFDDYQCPPVLEDAL